MPAQAPNNEDNAPNNGDAANDSDAPNNVDIEMEEQAKDSVWEPSSEDDPDDPDEL